jgi:hypothetical protein
MTEPLGDPIRPEGARIIRDGDTVIPLELIYAGTDAEGGDVCHVWTAATSVQPGDQLHVDMLPAHTSISFDGTQFASERTE